MVWEAVDLAQCGGAEFIYLMDWGREGLYAETKSVDLAVDKKKSWERF